MQKSRYDIRRDTRGAGFVEYIILVGVVALFGVGAYTFFGDEVDAKVREQGQNVTGIRGK